MSMSSMDGMSQMGMSGQQGAMTAYLHFTPLSDTLWFQYWVPTSPAAVLGACIGLFLLSIFERWVAACRAVAEKSWSQSAQLEMLANRLRQQLPLPEKSEPHNRDSKSSESSTTTPRPNVFRNMFSRYNTTTPFIPSHNISRGILHAIQTALSYLFMLASMTFQAAFIISMCLGAGVGEMMFGRYISGGSSHH
ncbi:Ctr copper transporter [Amanita muscaria]